MSKRDDVSKQFRLPINFQYHKTLGSGSYGTVAAYYAYLCNAEVVEYAVKRIPDVFDDTLVTRRTLREIKLMRHFSHPNVVRLIDVIPILPNGKDLYMITELLTYDLDTLIRSKRNAPFTHKTITSFAYQMLKGIECLHQARVIHRDLKPGNIFIRKDDGTLKIGDLGLSRGVDDPGDPNAAFLTEYVVTRWYRSPEILTLLRDKGKYDTPIDTWSAGCIIYEMIKMHALFPGKNCLDQLQRIVSCIGPLTDTDKKTITNKTKTSGMRMLEEVYTSCKIQGIRQRLISSPLTSTDQDSYSDLLIQMLKFNANERITITEALSHRVFERESARDSLKQAYIPKKMDFTYDKKFGPNESSSTNPRQKQRLQAVLREALIKEANENRGMLDGQSVYEYQYPNYSRGSTSTRSLLSADGRAPAVPYRLHSSMSSDSSRGFQPRPKQQLPLHASTSSHRVDRIQPTDVIGAKHMKYRDSKYRNYVPVQTSSRSSYYSTVSSDTHSHCGHQKEKLPHQSQSHLPVHHTLTGAPPPRRSTASSAPNHPLSQGTAPNRSSVYAHSIGDRLDRSETANLRERREYEKKQETQGASSITSCTTGCSCTTHQHATPSTNRSNHNWQQHGIGASRADYKPHSSGSYTHCAPSHSSNSHGGPVQLAPQAAQGYSAMNLHQHFGVPIHGGLHARLQHELHRSGNSVLIPGSHAYGTVVAHDEQSHKFGAVPTAGYYSHTTHKRLSLVADQRLQESGPSSASGGIKPSRDVPPSQRRTSSSLDQTLFGCGPSKSASSLQHHGLVGPLRYDPSNWSPERGEADAAMTQDHITPAERLCEWSKDAAFPTPTAKMRPEFASPQKAERQKHVNHRLSAREPSVSDKNMEAHLRALKKSRSTTFEHLEDFARAGSLPYRPNLR